MFLPEPWGTDLHQCVITQKQHGLLWCILWGYPLEPAFLPATSQPAVHHRGCSHQRERSLEPSCPCPGKDSFGAFCRRKSCHTNDPAPRQLYLFCHVPQLSGICRKLKDKLKVVRTVLSVLPVFLGGPNNPLNSRNGTVHAGPGQVLAGCLGVQRCSSAVPSKENRAGNQRERELGPATEKKGQGGYLFL